MMRLGFSLGMGRRQAGGGAPTQQLVVPATSAYFQDTANIPSSTSRITMRGDHFNFPSIPGGGSGMTVFSGISTPINMAILDDGSIQVKVEDGGGATAYQDEIAPAGTISTATDYAIEFDANHNGNVRVTVNGTDFTDTFTPSGSPTFQTTRKVIFLATSSGTVPVPAGTVFSNLEVDFNGTLHKAISNDAATANADAWHVGADFTQAT